MHKTTEALVLRATDYRESDQILTLFTRDLGKLTASARGVRKKNSPLAAGCQLLCWSEVVLFDYQGRWSVKEAASRRQFRGLWRDLERFALACYFADVAQLLAVEGEPFPELLSLTLNSLHALDELTEKPPALVKAAFELRCMCLAGYEPALDGCAVCGAEAPGEARFHLREGVLTCAGCGGGDVSGEPRPVGPQALAAMRYIESADPKRLFSFRAEGEGLAQLSAAAEGYLLAQMERGFRTLDYYKELEPGFAGDGKEGSSVRPSR